VIGGGVGVSHTGKQRSGEPKWRRAARLGAPVGSRRGATGQPPLLPTAAVSVRALPLQPPYSTPPSTLLMQSDKTS
jgi:hypothetical protein